jgi:hypothetical protein
LLLIGTLLLLIGTLLLLIGTLQLLIGMLQLLVVGTFRLWMPKVILKFYKKSYILTYKPTPALDNAKLIYNIDIISSTVKKLANR